VGVLHRLAHLDEQVEPVADAEPAVIHVICDNAGFHKPDKSKAVKKYLAEWSGRVVLHYLPTYSPDCNPVEWVWWRLHEAVTRNHRCRTMDELLDLTFDWFASRTHFRVRSRPHDAAARRGLLRRRRALRPHRTGGFAYFVLNGTARAR
jgi:transposase